MIVNSAYYRDDYDLPPPPSIWHRLNRLLWVLLILTVVATIIGAFLPELQKQRTELEARARLHKLIDAQRTLHTRYQNEIGWLQNDRDYLSIIARDRLDLMKEGETILRVEPAKTPSLPAETPALAPESHRAPPMH